MKVCSKCGLPNDDREYTWSIRGIKKHSACNECRAKDRMDYYERNKDAELNYKWARQLKKREEARIFVEAYKCTHPCVDCNEKDPEALTFDHVRGIKKMAISQMVNQSYSIEALVAEISKCEIHCWTCHMTAENRYRIANEWPLT